MSWIRSQGPQTTTPELAEVFERISARSQDRDVSNIWRSMALDPVGLAAADAHFRALRDDPSPLTVAQFELIATVVSAVNGCGYCVAHRGAALAAALGDPALARAVARDYREANIAARDRVLLDYAVALTCEPSERKLEDIERVREYGFDDVALLKATEIAAYYNFINRIASSLGVELEPGREAWEFGSQR